MRRGATLRPGGHGVEPVLSLAGVWQRVLEEVQADAEERVGWELHFLDSTVVRAARRRGGQGGSGAGDEALGRSRGGFTIHVRCEGKPVTFTLTEVHDSQQVTALINRGAIRPGTPAAGQAGWRQGLQQPQHPARSAQARHHPGEPDHERRQPNFDREAYRQRNIGERLINRLKSFRRIATRYEKRAANYLAMITIGAILLWI